MSSSGIVHKRTAGNRTADTNGHEHPPFQEVNGNLPLGTHSRRKINKKELWKGRSRSNILLYIAAGLLLCSILIFVDFKWFGWTTTKTKTKTISGPHHEIVQKQGQLRGESIGKAENWEEGDKTKGYALLRQEFDALLPSNDVSRMKNYVQSLKKNTYTTARPQDMSYDIYNCPDDPPITYPFAWNVLTILKNWEIDDPTPREHIYQGLCVFDYELDYAKAINYRDAEVPFIIQNDSRVLRTVERWNQPNYLNKLLGPRDYMAEHSNNSHFMYWMEPKEGQIKRLVQKLQQELEKWKPPTKRIRMTYQDWLEHANTTTVVGPSMEHWYFRLIGCGLGLGKNCEKFPAEFLFDELDFFRVDHGTTENPPSSSSLYIKDPRGQQGIHCRFGMRGVIAENHWDSSRNVIVVLGGERRYLLSHPNQCKYLELYPEGHPSARHSAVDWSKPDLISFPNFQHAQVNEVVLQAGDLLYLPTNWFHHIVSLELNYQCNTRSGRSKTYDEAIAGCSFKHL